MENGVRSGHVGVVEALVAAGFPVTRPEDEYNGLVDFTALYFAIRRESDAEELTKRLREHGADVNSGIDKLVPLYYAIRLAQDEIAASLLEPVEKEGREVSTGADANLFCASLYSPLQLAVWRGSEGLVAKLLGARARPEALGGAFGSTLNAAVWEDTPEFVRMLLGGPVRDVDGTEEVHDMTERRVVIANLMTPPLGAPLHTLYSNSQPRETPARETAALLVSSGADINARDSRGRTALTLAVIRRPNEDAKADALLGPVPNLADETGSAPLH